MASKYAEHFNSRLKAFCQEKDANGQTFFGLLPENMRNQFFEDFDAAMTTNPAETNRSDIERWMRSWLGKHYPEFYSHVKKISNKRK